VSFPYFSCFYCSGGNDLNILAKYPAILCLLQTMMLAQSVAAVEKADQVDFVKR